MKKLGLDKLYSLQKIKKKKKVIGVILDCFENGNERVNKKESRGPPYKKKRKKW